MKIFTGADHAGWEVKNKIMQSHPDIEWIDLGTHSKDRVDYPDFAHQVANKIQNTRTHSAYHIVCIMLDI